MVQQTYKQYSGKIIEQMPLVLQSGNVPVSIAGFMQHRRAILNQVGDTFTSTSDLIAYADRSRGDEINLLIVEIR